MAYRTALPDAAMNKSAEGPDRSIEPGNLTSRFRLLGLLPLLFFILHANYYLHAGGLSHLLWMCNIGNVLLAFGLLLGRPALIRIAVVWLLPGLPIWLWFVVRPGWWILTSFFAHAGGLIVGLIALQRVRASRWTWLQAFVWFLVIQEVCRLFIPPELNVNGAHRIFPEFEPLFGAYWQFWVVGSLVVSVGLWVIGFAFLKLFPPVQQGHPTSLLE
jgi:hypothetical protein